MTLYDEIYYVEDAKKEVLKFINQHFGLLLSFEVHRGFTFQIRIDKEQYESLDEETKSELMIFSETPRNRGVYESGSKKEKLWLEEHYWTNCDAYIFDFDNDWAYIIYARDNYKIVFFDMSGYPQVIWKNVGLKEGEKFEETN